MITRIAPMGSSDWYVTAVKRKLSGSKSGMVYLFGGSLEEVKAFIDSEEEGVKELLTWVPREYAMEDLFNQITY